MFVRAPWKSSTSKTSRIPTKVYRQIEELLKVNSNITARQLAVGSSTRDSILDAYPAFANKGKLRHATRVAKQRIGGSEPKTNLEILQFQKQLNDDFIVSESSNPEDGHICCQPKFCKDLILEWNGMIPLLETDSILSLITESGYAGEVNVTITSFWDPSNISRNPQKYKNLE
jgi:hypothetical protein